MRRQLVEEEIEDGIRLDEIGGDEKAGRPEKMGGDRRRQVEPR